LVAWPRLIAAQRGCEIDFNYSFPETLGKGGGGGKRVLFALKKNFFYIVGGGKNGWRKGCYSFSPQGEKSATLVKGRFKFTGGETGTAIFPPGPAGEKGGVQCSFKRGQTLIATEWGKEKRKNSCGNPWVVRLRTKVNSHF